jgi:cytochrome c peroxidase
MKTRILLGISTLCLTLAFCHKKPDAATEASYSSNPILPAVAYDYNANVDNQQATLGRVLFYDRKLSFNNSVSCASCHQQSKAFCDNQIASSGLQDMKTARNTPSIFARQGRAFWDGRAGSLENLALRPIQNHVEMKFPDLMKLSEKLAGIPYYADLFEKAFSSRGIDSTRIKKALAAFLKSFNFSDNKFAAFQGGSSKLTLSEQIGKDLFFGKAQCSNCHHVDGDFAFGGSGYGFTDMDFNIGLDQVYKDKGRGNVTGMSEDDGKFMVPVLLNVALTAPYMHDGRFKTLEEVVEHYNSGIKTHPNLAFELRDVDRFNTMEEADILRELDKDGDGDISEAELSNIPPRRLNLTIEEKKSLVAFLGSLTDVSIRTDVRFSDPFVIK